MGKHSCQHFTTLTIRVRIPWDSFNTYAISVYIFTVVEAEKINLKEGVNMLHTSYTKSKAEILTGIQHVHVQVY